MPKLLTPRIILAAIAVACIGILATAWYLQYGAGKQQPCPLCILQRYAFITLAMVCTLAVIHGPQRTGMIVYAVFADLLATTGVGLSLWQVSRGASMTSCLADPIGEFVNALPMANWWPEYFFASGGCADVYPPIFGLYTPQWSLVWFLILTAITTAALYVSLRRTR
jgi:disulfide bond formation protein DsbB